MDNEIQPTQIITPPVLSPSKPKKILLLILLGLILISISVYVGIQIGKKQIPSQQLLTLEPTAIPTQTNPITSSTDDWKIYSNTKYGFQLLYPKYGEISDSACFETGGKCGPNIKGECGYGIKEVNDSLNYYAIDNFFGIFPKTWSGSIVDYIKQEDPTNITYYSPISVKNADEAVEITGYDTSRHTEGPPPFVYTNYIFKKDNLLIIVSGFVDIGQVNGCVNYDKSLNWDVAKSFSFTE